MLRLLILLFFYFKLFVVLYVRHSEGFFEGATPFLIHLGSKLMYMVQLYVLTFLFYPFYGFLTFLLVTLFLFFSSCLSSYSFFSSYI
jgi:hypothetical protein